MRPPKARLVVISGCSGGGKSTLLGELASRGASVVEEPGRRIVAAELASGGDALPWTDLETFLRRAFRLAVADWQDAAARDDLVFFDRGVIDAASALQALTGEPCLHSEGERLRYHRRVFVTPPWRNIYVADAERRHGYEEAVAEYERLLRDYPALGYEVIEIPKISTVRRAEFVLSALEA